tara:strand:+ start:57061 stop:57441 length:381 start_codon:yes stop_codon:yes gene_type:complete
MSISRKTKTVKLILDLFKKNNNAISSVEIVSLFNQNMNKTTVYRILERLENSRIIHSFSGKDGIKRYVKGDQGGKVKDQQATHPHFLCEDCGFSSCLPLLITNPSISSFKINSSEHLYIGQCKECQ